MSSAQQISSYFASFGFRIDNASVTRLNAKIKQVKEHISKQLSISVKITKFTIGKRELNAAIKSAAQDAGGIRLSINSFSVNATELRKSVQAAFDKGVTLRVNATTRASGSGSPKPRDSGSGSRTNGVLSRYGIRGLAGYATGVGVMNVNQVSEDLQSSKVSLNTITGGRGVDAYQWLKNQGNAVGFDYRNQLPVFSSYLGASVNKQGYENSLDSYKNLTQYGLTHGSDRVSMERAMLAIGQMWSKGKIMGEELNQQLAEAKGFSGAKAIIADSYQESIGGKLTGQKAEAALIDAMKKGLVETAKVMPIATRRMGIEAAGGLDSYNKTTGAQHSRFTNALTNAVEVFGKGGFDEGMMRFFKFMADFLERHTEDIRKLGKNFLDLVKVFERIVGVGETVLGFFNNLNPSLTNMALLLAPLLGIMGKFSLAMTGIAFALDDINVYMQGGDSMIGRFLSYMKDLTGMDFTAVAAGFTVLSIGITAAFSPLIAVLATIGGLIEAYKYIQTLANKNLPTAPVKGAPSTDDLYAYQSGQYAKAFNKDGIANKLGGAAGVVSGFIAKSFGVLPASTGIDGAVAERLKPLSDAAFKGGKLSQDELDRYASAMNIGMMTEDQVASSLRYKINNIGNSATPMIFNATINGTFNNETVTLDNWAQGALPFFQGGTQPAKVDK